jgi:hypothetical protein
MPPCKILSAVDEGASRSVPVLTVVSPVKVLIPDSVNVPVPCLVSVVPEPEMTPLKELDVLLVLIVKPVTAIFPEPVICPVVDIRDKLRPPDV